MNARQKLRMDIKKSMQDSAYHAPHYQVIARRSYLIKFAKCINDKNIPIVALQSALGDFDMCGFHRGILKGVKIKARAKNY